MSISSRNRYTYLCAFAHYTSGTPAISTEYHTLDRPLAPEDISEFNLALQDRGFARPMVISFSLFDEPTN